MKSLSIAFLAVALTLPVVTSPAQAQKAYSQAARIESARQLIQANQDYIKQSETLHEKLQATIKVAEALKGRATELEIKANQTQMAPKLTGMQLKAAKAQFAADLQQFKVHANDYSSHLQQFQTTIGECHANQQQFQTQIQKFQIHAEEFHIPNIRPPHICGHLNLTVGESTHIANQIASDQQRLLQAEAQLQASENKLAGAMGETPSLQAKALLENKREVEEQKLAEEFARLREEYETLGIERAALGGGKVSASVSSQTVHGTVRK